MHNGIWQEFVFTLVLLDLLLLRTNGPVVLGQVVGILLIRTLGEDGLLPQVGGQVGVGLGDGGVGSLGEVAKGSGGATGRGVAILDTSHLKKLLGDGGRHEPGSSGGGDEPHQDGAALAGDLAGNGVGFTDLVTPETPTHGDDGELGQDDGATNGGGHLLGALDAETDVSVVVSNGNKGLEPGSLTGTGLLLNGHDLQNLVLESGSNEEVDDLALLQKIIYVITVSNIILASLERFISYQDTG